MATLARPCSVHWAHVYDAWMQMQWCMRSRDDMFILHLWLQLAWLVDICWLRTMRHEGNIGDIIESTLTHGYNSIREAAARCIRLEFSGFNTLRPRRNGQHFADDILKRIFFNENVWISIKISLKFVPKGPINNIPALVQIMVWRRSGDKPLSEPMMDSLPTHICVTRPQWVNCKSY